MSKKRIGFAGDGWGAVAAVKSLKKFFLLEFITNDEEVVEVLNEQHIKRDSFDELQCDVVLCSGYKPIISKELLSSIKFINVHYSLLPKYRGLHSTAWAIMNGEDELGLSVHLMNEFVDDGDIIHQKAFSNDQKSSATEYMNRMNEYIEANLGDVIDNFMNEKVSPWKQDKSQASWVGRRGAVHNMIDFRSNYEMTKRLFRVLNPPYPQPEIRYLEERFFVGTVKFHETAIETDVGRVLNVDNDGVWVKNKDGYLILSNIKDFKGENVEYSKFKIGHYIND